MEVCRVHRAAKQNPSCCRATENFVVRDVLDLHQKSYIACSSRGDSTVSCTYRVSKINASLPSYIFVSLKLTVVSKCRGLAVRETRVFAGGVTPFTANKKHVMAP